MSGVSVAGDLDNARAYWGVVKVQLGGSPDLMSTNRVLVDDTVYNNQVDSTRQGVILAAVNSCIRKYAAHLGIYAQDTIRVLDQTFVYTLGASYIEDATEIKPFKVFAITRDNATMYGVDRAERTAQMGNSSVLGPFPTLFDVIDDKFWINTTNNLDLIYFYGPVEGITMTDGADTTNVLEQDRSAICDCATALVWDEVAPGSGNGDRWWQKFEQHIIARGGTQPTRVP